MVLHVYIPAFIYRSPNIIRRTLAQKVKTKPDFRVQTDHSVVVRFKRMGDSVGDRGVSCGHIITDHKNNLFLRIWDRPNPQEHHHDCCEPDRFAQGFGSNTEPNRIEIV